MTKTRRTWGDDGARSFGAEVRVSGGKFRGQRLKTPGDGTHPMGERERIALFNMIAGDLEGARIADLYCGGGTLGIEALSRGAETALFVDSNSRAVATAQYNLEKLGLDDTAQKVILSDAGSVAQSSTNRYMVVIADPPYDRYDNEMVKYLPRLVRDGGILVLSHPGVAPEFEGLVLEKSRAYAGARISIYRRPI